MDRPHEWAALPAWLTAFSPRRTTPPRRLWSPLGGRQAPSATHARCPRPCQFLFMQAWPTMFVSHGLGALYPSWTARNELNANSVRTSHDIHEDSTCNWIVWCQPFTINNIASMYVFLYHCSHFKQSRSFLDQNVTASHLKVRLRG